MTLSQKQNDRNSLLVITQIYKSKKKTDLPQVNYSEHLSRRNQLWCVDIIPSPHCHTSDWYTAQWHCTDAQTGLPVPSELPAISRLSHEHAVWPLSPHPHHRLSSGSYRHRAVLSWCLHVQPDLWKTPATNYTTNKCWDKIVWSWSHSSTSTEILIKMITNYTTKICVEMTFFAFYSTSSANLNNNLSPWESFRGQLERFLLSGCTSSQQYQSTGKI